MQTKNTSTNGTGNKIGGCDNVISFTNYVARMVKDHDPIFRPTYAGIVTRPVSCDIIDLDTRR